MPNDSGTPLGAISPQPPFQFAANETRSCDHKLRTYPWVTRGVICMACRLDVGAMLVICGTYADQL